MVPAFSSKGFGLPGGKSEIGKILQTASEFLTGNYLISAYDIRYEHVPQPRDLPMKPELVFLDSGGYEISDDNDLSTVHQSTSGAQDWSAAELEAILDAWPDEMPAVFVSYDHPNKRHSLPEQIAAARELFKGRTGQLNCFLVKPETNKQQTLGDALKAAMAAAGEMHAFDIVGVTEKELGGSCLDRMVHIARLRRSLDEAKVSAPIHIFGSLDPVSVCLYFMSGAEIFDGLTWIRYAFAEDRCVYVHNHAALMYGIHVRDADLRLRVMSQNYYYLESLQERLKDFQAGTDFSKLPHSSMMKAAWDSLERRLAKGGD